MRNDSDESPSSSSSSSRLRSNYQLKNKNKMETDSTDDFNEEERYRQDDLRNKLNELKKNKDNRVSSSDRDQHNKHRNSRQLQVHDYDPTYYKPTNSKRENFNRDSHYQNNNSQKHYSTHYSKDNKNYDRRHSDQKRSSKKISSGSESKHVEQDIARKSEKYQKRVIEAEVNEIVSEEEEKSSDESIREESTKQQSKKSDNEQNSGVDSESENLRAEIDLRNKLKRKIQAKESNNQTDEDENEHDSNKKLKDRRRSNNKQDSDSNSSKRNSKSKSPYSSKSNSEQNSSVASDQSDEAGSNYSNRSNTPERNDHETPSESDEKDPLDEKIDDYFKKASIKKTDSEKPSTLKESEKINDEQQQKSETILAPPPPTPDIITYYCATQGSRSVEEFECLNKIEEGAYGVVFRAKDKKSNEVVALKRLKMEKEKEGFPITSIREIDTLLKAQHPNVVTVREIVVGSNMDKIYMVMDYVEHDLKSLMQYSMKKPFLMSEVKTLMLQLLRGVAHLHDNWIIHRDLKTSNLLLSHKGVLKIADFGLAREYGSPLKEYTAVVVTLWYRSPELLLATKKYSTGVDIWSVGCIFGELMLMKALFPGKFEKDQLDKIFKDLGTPNDKIWPNFKDLPLTKSLKFPDFPYNTLRSRFGTYLSDKGFELINKLLTYDPERRISAEDALKHDFFKESPFPLDATIFPTWPAKSEGLAKTKLPQDSEPRAPSPGKMYEKLLGDDEGFVLQFPNVSTGFTLR